ncbi:unnamed protein product [Danaus chrysippus]|uniref:(African queen) hypothetical protein n=1 Tax=Danaus chrysippus TaxID=151541 RepID=A0A8J2QE44_9NEOP|nr:unnamed protein product [Danaus chrysippus]
MLRREEGSEVGGGGVMFDTKIDAGGRDTDLVVVSARPEPRGVRPAPRQRHPSSAVTTWTVIRQHYEYKDGSSTDHRPAAHMTDYID